MKVEIMEILEHTPGLQGRECEESDFPLRTLPRVAGALQGTSVR